ncbi:TIR domain-containing protein [Longimicrobium sp.]|uniref:TIR domain-containing protein n=1 Tax=Longimicrobium sp. TaxID=2029185 RepID=UPI003B3B7848
MTTSSNASVNRLLAALSTGDVRSRRDTARILAAFDVRGGERALLDAFDDATDDVVKLWLAVALARAGNEVGLEELFGRWRQDPDYTPLSDEYPDAEQLAEHLAPLLPLHAAATQLLESYARAENTWFGELARMLLGRGSPPEQSAVPRARPGGHGGQRSRPHKNSIHRPGVEGRGNFSDFDGEFGVDKFEVSNGLDAAAPDEFEPEAAAASDDHEPEAAAAPDGHEPEAPAPPPSSPVTFEAAPPPQASPSAEPPVTGEPVLLGGSAPRQVQPGDFFLAQLSVYTAAYEPKARQALAREAEADEIRLGAETECRWPVGTRVSVRCKAKGGLIVSTEAQTFTWNGQCHTFSFDVEVPEDARPRDALLVMELFVHDREDAPDAVRAAWLSMEVEITAQPPATSAPPQTVKGAAARTAFASYASADRLDVLERASSIRRSAGIDVKVDVLFLEMGEKWNDGLLREIEACDKLMLFWSEHTPKSKWVEWEWKHAIQTKGEDVLELHLLRHTPIDQVPEELRKYHFNDAYIMARDAELYRLEQAAKAAAAKPADA